MQSSDLEGGFLVTLYVLQQPRRGIVSPILQVRKLRCTQNIPNPESTRKPWRWDLTLRILNPKPCPLGGSRESPKVTQTATVTCYQRENRNLADQTELRNLLKRILLRPVLSLEGPEVRVPELWGLG